MQACGCCMWVYRSCVRVVVDIRHSTLCASIYTFFWWDVRASFTVNDHRATGWTKHMMSSPWQRMHKVLFSTKGVEPCSLFCYLTHATGYRTTHHNTEHTRATVQRSTKKHTLDKCPHKHARMCRLLCRHCRYLLTFICFLLCVCECNWISIKHAIYDTLSSFPLFFSSCLLGFPFHLPSQSPTCFKVTTYNIPTQFIRLTFLILPTLHTRDILDHWTPRDFTHQIHASTNDSHGHVHACLHRL